MELLTGPRIMAGHGLGPIRCCHLADRLGVMQRTTFYEWLEAEGLLLAPFTPHWGDSLLAGCVELEVIRERLRKAIRTGERLPFSCVHVEELSHAAA